MLSLIGVDLFLLCPSVLASPCAPLREEKSVKKYRVGIIGCGGRAGGHADAFRHMEEVEIAGAADLQPERLQKFCDRWEIENRYQTSTQLLEAQKLDLVTLVTLPGPRPQLAEECAAAGVPVINAEKVVAFDMAAAGPARCSP